MTDLKHAGLCSVSGGVVGPMARTPRGIGAPIGCRPRFSNCHICDICGLAVSTGPLFNCNSSLQLPCALYSDGGASPIGRKNNKPPAGPGCARGPAANFDGPHFGPTAQVRSRPLKQPNC